MTLRDQEVASEDAGVEVVEVDFADGLSLTKSISGTREFKIAKQSAMVARQSDDVEPLMIYRETPYNGYEAGAKNIIIDVDWAMVKKHGVYKAVVIDDGHGMASDELSHHLVTIADADLDNNFGWGCRVAALSQNGMGTIFKTKTKSGKGAMAMFHRKADGTAGLGLWDFEETGRISDMEVPDSVLHPLIRKAGQGTEVTFMGNDEAEDTFLQESTVTLKRFLNQRFFEPPVRIRLREFDSINPNKLPNTKPRGGLVDIIGMKAVLDQNSRFNTVIVDNEIGATYYVWILKNRPTNVKASEDLFHRAAHSAAVHNGEVYEVTNSRAAMREFGFTQTAPGAVVYVEPHNAKPTTNRLSLRINNRELDWKKYKRAFSKHFKTHRKMAPVRTLENKLDKKNATGSLDKKSVEKVIAEWRDRYPGYDEWEKKKKGGTHWVTGRDGRAGGNDHNGEGGSGGGSGARGGKGGSGGTSISKPNTRVSGGIPVKAKVKGDGTIRAARKKRTLFTPDFIWVSNPEEHGLLGRGGIYTENTNKLVLNTQYPACIRVVNYLAEELGVQDKPFTVEGKVRDAFAKYVLIGLDDMRRKRNTEDWDEDQTEEQFTPESISVLVDVLSYPIANELCRSISINLGSKSRRGK